MTTLRSIKIWDIGIRLFHWALVLLLPLLWLLAEQDEAIEDWASSHGWYLDPVLWHARLGYTVLGLLVFRLLWGFVGSDTARFSQFLRHPKLAIASLKALLKPASAAQANSANPTATVDSTKTVESTKTAEPPISIGHNPAGGWMVLLMLLLLIVQSVTGLFNFDDVDFEAPLYALVSDSVSEFMHEWHEINFNILLAAVLVHLNAIAFYTWVKREPLVPAMLHGNRMLAVATGPRIISGWRLLLCALIGAASSFFFWR
ncbi:hypothetical protein HPT27_12550 [Permianibacter sp. IMCC34836]|uniref:cytochrome b/b6 domain-containing protein n=1 Tax=Permianibacter fluminis TaxID=2738515 RepID=UPI001557DADE|nr:cytochrome b/b6 domain-containing protein [Permianibacter fluminis]NQD37858.1 hypothetical protein [Permianibacter fluminis]